MRLRQVCLVARQLEPTVESLAALLDTEICYRDPGISFFGLENALLPLGTDFLEVVAPIEAETAASRHLERRGEGGYMLLIQCEDGKLARERALGQGARAVWQHDENGIQATHFHPRSVPGAILSLDSMEPEPGELGPGLRWDWAGPDWRTHLRPNGIRGLAGARIEASQPEPAADRWSAVLGLPRGSGPELSIALENGALGFGANACPDATLTAFGVLHSDPDAVLGRAETLGFEIDGSRVSVAGVQIDLQSLRES
ncbi:MAG: VOC family protein [Myxococcota bacterium]|nr:VOC family protein [Myxococcota bacterium]